MPYFIALFPSFLIDFMLIVRYSLSMVLKLWILPQIHDQLLILIMNMWIIDILSRILFLCLFRDILNL